MKRNGVSVKHPADVAGAVDVPVHVNVRVPRRRRGNLVPRFAARQLPRVPAKRGLALEDGLAGKYPVRALGPF